mmetsp:Transcript_7953/g.24564  ORF Transcript_7953/g.24564 Transcript_7953/m.24564 type:complete len:239 (+) Transcript_7953:413-1129(+)
MMRKLGEEKELNQGQGQAGDVGCPDEGIADAGPEAEPEPRARQRRDGHAEIHRGRRARLEDVAKCDERRREERDGDADAERSQRFLRRRKALGVHQRVPRKAQHRQHQSEEKRQELSGQFAVAAVGERPVRRQARETSAHPKQVCGDDRHPVPQHDAVHAPDRAIQGDHRQRHRRRGAHGPALHDGERHVQRRQIQQTRGRRRQQLQQRQECGARRHLLGEKDGHGLVRRLRRHGLDT